MSNPNGLDRLALAILSAGVAVTVLGGCHAPYQVIGRTGTASNVRAGLAGKAPVVPASATQQRQQVLVKFKARLQATELTTFRAAFGLRNVGEIAALGVFVEEVAEGRQVGDVLRELNASPMVEYAELNGTVGIDP